MPLDKVGILQPIDFSNEQPTVIYAVAREIFVNEAPLVARLPRSKSDAVSYTITSYDVRQRTYATNSTMTNVATSLPIADSTPFLVGDVLEIVPVATGTAERVQVTAIPDATHLTVARGVEGTTGAAVASADPVTLIANARQGNEVDQVSNRAVRTTQTQNVQTFLFSAQLGGLANAIGAVALPEGAGTVFGLDRAVKLTEMYRDMENSSYYGIGQTPAASGDSAKQKGLKALIKSGNVKTNGGSSYTKASFIADTVQKIYDAGGQPDTVICSTDFLTGLDTWVPGKAGYLQETNQTEHLGFEIEEMLLPLGAKKLNFIPSLQLAKGTAIVVTWDDLSIKYIREEAWYPRGRRGDAIEGDWIGDLCVNLNHNNWHAWVSGITSFA